MAVPVVANYTSNTAVPGGSVSLTKPSGVTSGDLLIIIGGNDDATATVQFQDNISGFTRLTYGGNNSPDAHLGIYYRVADGTEGATTNLTATTATNDLWGFYIRVTGADTTDPINVTGTVSTVSSNTTHTAAGVTTTVAECLGFYALAYDGGDSTFSVASPWTETAEIKAGTGASNASGCWGTQSITSAGASGNAVITSTVADGSTRVVFAVAPMVPPAITNAEDEGFFNTEAGVIVTGTNFGATQGTGKIELGNSATYASATKVSQSVTSWGNTSITMTVTQGALNNGSLWLYVTSNAGLVSTAYPVILDTRPTITDAGDESFYNGQTGIIVTGTNFKSTKGVGTLSLNTAANGTGTNVVQTTTSWGDSSITFTLSQGTIPNGTAYLIVQNSNYVETTGYAVTLGTRPTITNAADELFYDGELSVVITGTNFGATQGSGTVELNSTANGTGTTVDQGVSVWGNTSITISITQGALTAGTNYLIVHTNSLLETAGYAVAVYPRPTITDADDEIFYHTETGVVITGTDFGSTQGSGSVELNTAQNGSGSLQAQTVTSWGNTSITINVNQGSLSAGTLYLIVNHNNGLDSNGYAVAVYPKPTISDAGDETYSNGETGIVVTGTNFQTPQGTGSVQLNSASDGSGIGITQTVTAWGGSSITFNVVQGVLDIGTNYLIITTRHGIASTGYAITLLIPPLITDADNEAFYDGQINVTITGTTFGASQGVGSVSLNSDPNGLGTDVSQTVTSWSDNSITITISQGSLSYGTNHLIVNNNAGGVSAGYTVALGPQPIVTDAGNENFVQGDSGVIIDGSNFGTSQGTGYVVLNTSADGSGFAKTQTVTSWNDASIIIAIDIGALDAGTLYLIIYNDYGVKSDGYAVNVQKVASGIGLEWFIDYIPHSPLQLSHVDGSLDFDSGSGTIPSKLSYIRGNTSGSVAKILDKTGTAITGTLTLTNTTLPFINNESLTWLNQVKFDGVVNGGLAIGDTVTGVTSGRTGIVRFIEYYGTYGYLYSEGFTGGSWTNNENIRVSGQTKALVDGTGSVNSTQWTGALANGLLATPTTSGILNYEGGSVQIPVDAKISGSISTATGIVHLQFGTITTGSLRLNDVDDIWVDSETIIIEQVVNYDNVVTGKKFRIGNKVTGDISGASGRILKVINDDDGTGRIILADQTGTFDAVTPDNLLVAGIKIAEVENATFTTHVANTNGALRTTQTLAQGGLYHNSLNPVRSINSLYSYLMDTFDEIVQLDDMISMTGQVKNQQYTMVNGWMIPDLSMRFLDKGSIQDEDQNNIWTNLATVGDIQGITDLSFAATTPQPEFYVSQNNQLITPFWIEGHINILVKMKTNSLATVDDIEGQTLGDGNLVVYVRNYSHHYSHTEADIIGGVATVPLSTNLDINNITATYSLNYDNQTTGTFIEGEQIALANHTVTGTITKLTDSNPTGTIEYILTSATNFANNNPISGSTSGASADVNGTPTALVAGYTDITITFAGVSYDLGNGHGPRPYDCVVNCNYRPLSQVYEYLKFITAKEYTGIINGISGNQYQAVGDIRLVYDSQTGSFTQGLTVTGNTSEAVGIIVSDHNTGTSGALILRTVFGTFQAGETIADTGAGSASVSGSTETISQIKSAPFGTLAGGKFFGACGVWLANVYAADSNDYELIDSLGERQIPPQSITLTVNGLVIGDQVAIFKTTGDNNTIEKSMFTIDGSQPVGTTTQIRVNESIPADTPATGTIRLVHRTATGRIENEEKLSYSTFNNTNQPSYSTFTVPSFASTLDSTDTAYVPYIDTAATSTTESVALIYVSDRYITTRVRKSGILPFMTKGQITGANTTITAVRATDPNI